MKNLNLPILLFLSLILHFSCQPKKEKKQPVINFTVQKYKYDDDELTKKSTNDSLNNFNKNKRGKMAVEK